MTFSDRRYTDRKIEEAGIGEATTDASDLTTGTLPFARLPIGTTSTTVPAGNDTRLSDARTPTAHKTSHATGGGDALAPSDIGAVPTSRTLAGLDLTADQTMSALRAALGIEPWVVTCPGATPTRLATITNYAFAMRCYGAGTISKIALQIGTSSGNICVGVYSSTGVAYNAVPDARLATSGSVACPSTGWQEVALGASVDVKTGDWLVVAFDNSTATVFGVASPGSGLANHGLSRTQSSAFPLPSTFTPAASGDRQVRLWGIP